VRGPGKRGYFSKLFSDGKYGGKDKALEAARTYQEELNQIELPQLSTVPPYKSKPQINNTSGVLGVGRTHAYHGQTGQKQEYWYAFCPVGPDGRTFYTKRFYITEERDEEEAFRLAVEFRRMWEAAADQGKQAIQQFWDEVESGWLY
jgi:hypothetical protein